MYFGHVAATCFLFAAFYALWRARSGEPGWLLARAGFLAGWVVLVDFPMIPGVAVLLAYARWVRRRASLVMVAGGLPSRLLLLWYNWTSFGGPFSLGYANLVDGSDVPAVQRRVLPAARRLDRRPPLPPAGAAVWRRIAAANGGVATIVSVVSQARRRPRRKQRADRLAQLARCAAPDVLALAALGLLLLAILTYLALLPPTRLAFAIDQVPPEVTLQNFYGVEHNSGGAYRWSQPEASLTVAVNGPATYRLTLTLQDNPAAVPRRPVTIYVDGMAVRIVSLDDTPRPYSVDYDLTPERWARTPLPMLPVELKTTPFIPPGDPRALGVLVTGLAVTPLGPPAPWQPALMLPYLLALPLVYGALRALRLTTLRAAIVLAGVLGAFGLLALVARRTGHFLAYRPIAEPLWVLGALLVAAPLPWTARLWPALVPASPAQPTADASPSDPAAARLPDHLEALWSRRSLPALAVIALALGLRLDRVNARGLWLDEGYTILFTRLPWPTVLGLRGRYDLKPPLYFAATKLVSTVVPEVYAGRLLSVVAGTLTVVVLYALAVRLVGRPAALCASLALALSPLHLWYSQEGRMYALCVLLVALSYLALVALYRGESLWWAAVYGLAIVLAMYADYSSGYALAPQVFLLALITKRHGRRALAVWGAFAAAVLGFLPWLGQVLSAMEATGGGLAWFLGVSPGKILDSLLAISGFSGISSYYWGHVLTPWARWPGLHPVILLAIAPAVIAGITALTRRFRLAAIVAVGLLIGTIGVATLVSLVSPGYADRTVLYATLGWALLIGAAPFTRAPRWLAVVGSLSLAFIVVMSALSIGAIGRQATKQQYRELAARTALAATFGLPIVSSDQDDVTATLIDVYQPHLLDRGIRTRAGKLPPTLGRMGEPDALWFVYGDNPWNQTRNVRTQLAAAGYARLMHQYFPDPLYLDLYARPGARLGVALPHPAGFSTGPGGWRLPVEGSRLDTPERGEQVLVLVGSGNRARMASLDVDVVPNSLFVAEFDVRAHLITGEMTASLT